VYATLYRKERWGIAISASSYFNLGLAAPEIGADIA